MAPFLFLAAAVVGVLRWQAAHPLPMRWDEANYVNFAIADHRFFATGGLMRVVKALVFEDPVRPPAYRALALPVTMFVEPTMPLLRAISLIGTAIAAWLLYLAWRRVTTPFPAATMVALTFLTPAVLVSAGWFGTEYPLFIAVALLMLALIPRPSFLPLMLSVALGLLSKSTFFMIAGAPLAMAAMFAWHDRNRRDFLTLAGGSLAGAVIASGWWIWHVQPALAFAQYGRIFPREATDSIVEKLRELVVPGFGAAMFVAMLLLVVASIRTSGTRARWLAAAASLPLIAFAFFSPAFTARHLSPALLTLPMLALPVLEKRSRLAMIALGIAALQAIALVVAPLRVLPHVEQTDFAVLRTLIPGPRPKIAYLGGWSSLSPPEVRHAWVRNGQDAEVGWLWNCEDPPIDWQKVMATALDADSVFVVAPEASSREAFTQCDNAHNREFIERINASGRFATPVRVPIGNRERAEVLVFAKR